MDRGRHIALLGTFEGADAAVEVGDALGDHIGQVLLGEITPAMAAAVCQSGAKRVLVPINHCENYVVGVPEQPVSQLVSAAAQKVKALCEGKTC